MKVVLFCHSLVSDWNHGNAHFLRGLMGELIQRGHRVSAYEPRDSWSRMNMVADRGSGAVAGFRQAYPRLSSIQYEPGSLDLDRALAGADLVLVHEWNDAELVSRIGEWRRRHGNFSLLFHDTHHRSVTDPKAMARYDLSGYDGVLAFGEVVRERYLKEGWAARAWTMHEAADPRVFHPHPGSTKIGDLVWVGNWGDGERTDEIAEFLIDPVKRLGLRATVYGVRYPADALRTLEAAGIEYGGSVANYEVPELFSRYRLTIHIPRRPYAEALPGIPTIRIFEALACRMPLVSAPWDDREALFRPGTDFLVARDGDEMRLRIGELLNDPEHARRVASCGQARVLQRHTCSHRVDELLRIHQQIQAEEALTPA